MKSLFFFIVVFLIGFSMVGCRNMRPTVETTRTVKDSTYTEVTYRKKDTVIFIPGDTTRMTIPIKLITEKPLRTTKGNTTTEVSRVGDDLHIACINEEMELKIQLLLERIKEVRSLIDSSKERIEVPKPYTPLFAKILAWIGGLSLGAIAVLFGFKFLKP